MQWGVASPAFLSQTDESVKSSEACTWSKVGKGVSVISITIDKFHEVTEDNFYLLALKILGYILAEHLLKHPQQMGWTEVIVCLYVYEQ